MDSLENWKKSLKDFSENRNVCVLVEGKKDYIKLASFNIKNIYTLKGRKFYDVVEELVNRCQICIILFDLDKHGERMTQKFIHLLTKEGVNVDTTFRDALKNFNVEEIENIV